MVGQEITVRGTVLPDGTLELPEGVKLPPGPVEVVVRPVTSARQGQGVMEVLARIRAEQAASGYVPRSAEEVDAQLRQLREEWEERDAAIEASHDAGRSAGGPPSEPGAAS